MVRRGSSLLLALLCACLGLGWAGPCNAGRSAAGAAGAIGASSRGSVRISLTVVPKFAIRPLKITSRKAFGTRAGSNDQLCVDGNVAPASYSVSKVTDDGIVPVSPASPDDRSGCFAQSEAGARSADGPSAAGLPREGASSGMITLLIAAQ